eukprot:GHVT01043222.1.p1 GENE.GHVT01043222.1~~GHVT01043222.1.p1  ORF type:complete len:288 (-),score=65.48 GHVT01043222.1:850-1713(-)
MAGWLSRVLPSEADLLRPANLKGWLASHPDRAKVVLFTDKKVIPPLFKALSHMFRRRLQLGVVLSTETSLLQKFRTFPGKFPAIFYLEDLDTLEGEWVQLKTLNLDTISLTLTRIAAQKSASIGPYGEHVTFREFTKRSFSSGDCTQEDGQFCFLLFVHDLAAMTPAVVQTFKGVAQSFKRDPVKLAWVDVSKQTAFAAAFGLATPPPCNGADATAPAGCPGLSFVGYRPKRKKFLVLEGGQSGLTESSVGKFLESVIGGATRLPTATRGAPLMVDAAAFQQPDDEL